MMSGWHLGAGKNKSYDLAKEGVIPTIKVGGCLRVPARVFFSQIEGMAAATA